ncbi:MAG: peptide deformylase [Geminicoccaceae bacterium]
MTLRKIARMGEPVLLTEAPPVADPTDPALQALIEDMLETMRDADGIGLAAPQVYASTRLVLAMDLVDRDAKHEAPVRVLINPELTPLGEEIEPGWEGCLSIPDLRGLVPRWKRVGWRALDRTGRPIEGEAQGLFARVLQHEVDHLDGVLYTMRLDDPRHLAFLAEMPHLRTWIEAGGDA